jgi:hypothetical protein
MRLWPTPRASAGGKEKPKPANAQRAARGGMNLASAAVRARPQALLWGTPSVADVDGGRLHRSGARSNELLLKGQALRLSETWATPTARDHRSIHASRQTRERNSRPLSEQVGGFCSRPDRLTSSAGRNSSAADRTLNPLFVEALMGLPIGWTGFGFAGTEWCRWSRLMRCELSRLGFCLPAGDGLAIEA